MTTLIYLHLAAIVPALLIGPFILFRRKGDAFHKNLGKVWAVLMIIGSLLSFGIQHNGGFSWLHGLAAFTIFSVGKAVYSIRKGNLKDHQRNMIGSYIGSFIAAIFALHPERLLGLWMSGLM